MDLDYLFIFLILLCFVVSFLYNKKNKIFKRIFKSFIHTVCIVIISFYLSAIFLAPRYDMRDRYPDIPIFEILDCLGHILAFGIPILYIIITIIKNYDNKKLK